MRSRLNIAAYANNVRRRKWRRRLRIGGEPVQTAIVDTAYDGFALSASGGSQPYTFVVAYGALPDGVILDPETGEVAGTPTETGSFTVTLGVRDAILRTALLPAFVLEVSA